MVSLAFAVVLGSVISLICIGLVGHAANAAQESINEGPALRTVELRDQTDRPDIKALRGTHLAALASVPHVTLVEPWVQASFGIKTPQIGGALLYATPARESEPPPIVKSIRDAVFPLRGKEIVLPARSQDENLEVLLGQQVPVTYTRKIAEGEGESASDTVTVVAVYDPKYAIDGPAAAYAPRDLIVRWASARAGVPEADFEMTVGYRKVYAMVDASENVPAVVQTMRSAGYEAVSVRERLTALPAGLRTIRLLGFVVFGLLLFYGAFSGIAISGSFMKARTREIGLLNAIGFRQNRIMRILLLELALVGGLAGVLGAALGVLATMVAGFVASGKDIAGIAMPAGIAWPGWQWVLLILLTPPLTVAIGGLLPAWRVARLQPDLALRDQT